jgi:hypothetical protein
MSNTNIIAVLQQENKKLKDQIEILEQQKTNLINELDLAQTNLTTERLKNVSTQNPRS